MNISIVICTYNGQKYIEEQLDSIRMQTRSPFEVLISDDCSTDRTRDVITDYIEKYSLGDSWKLIMNESNIGWKANFMNTIPKASGELICTCDQDDFWRIDKLELFEKLFSAKQSMDLLISDFIYIDNSKLSEKKQFFLDPEPVSKTGDELLERIDFYRKEIFHMQGPGCTFCFRKSYFLEICNYWKDYYPHDAYIYRVARLKATIYKYKEPLVLYRRHSSAATIGDDNTSTGQRVIAWSDYALGLISGMYDAVKAFSDVARRKEALLILDFNSKWLKHRKKLFAKHSIIEAVYMLHFRGCYTRYKAVLDDIKLALKRGG